MLLESLRPRLLPTPPRCPAIAPPPTVGSGDRVGVVSERSGLPQRTTVTVRSTGSVTAGSPAGACTLSAAGRRLRRCQRRSRPGVVSERSGSDSPNVPSTGSAEREGAGAGEWAQLGLQDVEGGGPGGTGRARRPWGPEWESDGGGVSGDRVGVVSERTAADSPYVPYYTSSLVPSTGAVAGDSGAGY
eukprot:757816-Hanusia_phi.AAC.1